MFNDEYDKAIGDTRIWSDNISKWSTQNKRWRVPNSNKTNYDIQVRRLSKQASKCNGVSDIVPLETDVKLISSLWCTLVGLRTLSNNYCIEFQSHICQSLWCIYKGALGRPFWPKIIVIGVGKQWKLLNSKCTKVNQLAVQNMKFPDQIRSNQITNSSEVNLRYDMKWHVHVMYDKA